jgi:hypothetical protein
MWSDTYGYLPRRGDGIQTRRFNEGSHVSLFPLAAFQFLGQDRHGHLAGLRSRRDAELEHLHDLLHGRAKCEGSFDMPARAGRVHVSEGCIVGDAQKLDEFGTQHALLINGGSNGEELIGPHRVQIEERVPGRVPLADGPHLVAERCWLALAALQRGELQVGLATMAEALSAYRATGTRIFLPFFLSFLAEAYRQLGRTEEGLKVVTEALRLTATTLEVFWETELYRLKGTLTLQKFQVSR